MESRALTKLFNHSASKLLCCQVASKKLPKEKGRNFTSFQSINPDICFLKKITYFPVTPKNIGIIRSQRTNLSTVSSVCLVNKSRECAKFAQVPSKSFSSQLVQSRTVQERGWAGQPVVKRIHPILPEVFGDISDIFYLVESEASTSPKGKEVILSSAIKTTAETINSSVKLDKSETVEELKNLVRNDVSISAVNNNSKRPVVKPVIEIKSTQFYKKYKNPTYAQDTILKPGIFMKSEKKAIKKKRKTKILDVKPTIKKVKANSKKSAKAFDRNKKSQVNTHLVLNQRINTQAFPKNYLLMGNRQLKTNTALYYSKLAAKINVKEKLTKIELKAGKKRGQKKKKNYTIESLYKEDCICPETEVNKGVRKSTDICGTASGVDEKKMKKKWKPKMCLVEKKIKRRRKTFLCAHKIKNDVIKRKRNLPKCPKPEKKPIPRSVICLPNLEEEEIKEEKKCIKQVEEIKIRKLTKVCKPVIVYGKKEAGIKTEKAICTETKVKKIKSKHTKVCPPPKGKRSKKEKTN